MSAVKGNHFHAVKGVAESRSLYKHLSDDHVLQMVRRFVVLELDVKAVFDAHLHLQGIQSVGLLGTAKQDT